MASKITPIGRSRSDPERPRSAEASALPDGGSKGSECESVQPAVETSCGGTIDGECILVPAGEYELRYLHYETRFYFQTARVIVHFAIVEPDEYAGLPIERFFNVDALTGPPKKYGDFIAKRRGALTREYRRIAGPIQRHDRLSFAPFSGLRIFGQVVTVTKDPKRHDLSEDEYYSKVDRLIRVLAAE